MSTNGVDITTVELPIHGKNGSLIIPVKNGSLLNKHKRKGKVVLNVWDFGGQAVFHSTHRFFLTSSAIYLVIYNMADEQTHSRLQYPFFSEEIFIYLWNCADLNRWYTLIISRI